MFAKKISGFFLVAAKITISPMPPDSKAFIIEKAGAIGVTGLIIW